MMSVANLTRVSLAVQVASVMCISLSWIIPSRICQRVTLNLGVLLVIVLMTARTADTAESMTVDT